MTLPKTEKRDYFLVTRWLALERRGRCVPRVSNLTAIPTWLQCIKARSIVHALSVLFKISYSFGVRGLAEPWKTDRPMVLTGSASSSHWPVTFSSGLLADLGSDGRRPPAGYRSVRAISLPVDTIPVRGLNTAACHVNTINILSLP